MTDQLFNLFHKGDLILRRVSFKKIQATIDEANFHQDEIVIKESKEDLRLGFPMGEQE